MPQIIDQEIIQHTPTQKFEYHGPIGPMTTAQLSSARDDGLEVATFSELVSIVNHLIKTGNTKDLEHTLEDGTLGYLSGSTVMHSGSWNGSDTLKVQDYPSIEEKIHQNHGVHVAVMKERIYSADSSYVEYDDGNFRAGDFEKDFLYKVELNPDNVSELHRDTEFFNILFGKKAANHLMPKIQRIVEAGYHIKPLQKDFFDSTPGTIAPGLSKDGSPNYFGKKYVDANKERYGFLIKRLD